MVEPSAEMRQIYKKQMLLLLKKTGMAFNPHRSEIAFAPKWPGSACPNNRHTTRQFSNIRYSGNLLQLRFGTKSWNSRKAYSSKILSQFCENFYREIEARIDKKEKQSLIYPEKLSAYKCAIRVVLRRVILSSVIPISLMVLCYAICYIFSWLPLFQSLFCKIGVALGSRALYFACVKLGLSGGLALAFGFFVKGMMTGEVGSYIGHWMMSPSGSEASVNQAPDPAPHQPVFVPLLADEIRRQELLDRLTINSLAKGEALSLEKGESIVGKQLLIEKKIEEALLSDGYERDSLLNKRHEIRGFLFYPQGKPFLETTYAKYLDRIMNHGTHRSLPYNRILDAIRNKNLSLANSADRFEILRQRAGLPPLE